MSEQRILKEIIQAVIREQIEAFRQIEELDAQIPWLKDVVGSLSDRITRTKTEMAIDPLEDGLVQISFTGPPDVLLAILRAFDGRFVGQSHEKPSNPWNDSTIRLVVDTIASQAEEEI